MDKLIQQGSEAYNIQVGRVGSCMIGCSSMSAPQMNLTEDMSTLRHQYDHLFQEPTQLPPKRPLDHEINLQPSTGPINIRPYRYPAIQKDAIELMVQKMLTAGIIRPSHNPFSSPIVLVKKKDNTSRLCVDYRETKLPLKTSFPFP